jgi:hypothetical protein
MEQHGDVKLTDLLAVPAGDRHESLFWPSVAAPFPPQPQGVLRDVDERAELASAGKTCAVPRRGLFDGELDAVDLTLVAVVVLAALVDDKVAGHELSGHGVSL